MAGAFLPRRCTNWRPTARLLVAGTPVQPGLDDAFRRAIAALAPGSAAPVEWLGYVQRDDLAAIYAAAGCAIFPADAVPLQQAKCSVRLATTLLAGMPVVASAVGEQVTYGADGAARLVPAWRATKRLCRSGGRRAQRPGSAGRAQPPRPRAPAPALRLDAPRRGRLDTFYRQILGINRL